MEEKESTITELRNRLQQLKKAPKQVEKPNRGRKIQFNEDDLEQEDSHRSEKRSLNRSIQDASFQGSKDASQNKDKFFNDLLREVSNKNKKHEIIMMKGMSTSIKMIDTEVFQYVGCVKLGEPKTEKPQNSAVNNVIMKAREERKRELEKIAEEKRIAEEKARKEREAREAEERRKAEEARKKAEEEAKRKAEEAKKRAEEEAKRKEEERKKAQEQAAAAAAANQGAANNAGPGQQATTGQADANQHMTQFMQSLEMSPDEIQAIQQMGTAIMPLREEIAKKGLNSSQAAFIVTLKNVPGDLNTEKAKAMLTQLQTKFDNLKVDTKENITSVLVRVTGLEHAVKYLLLRGQNIAGKTIQVDLKLADSQVTKSAQQGPGQAQGQAGQQGQQRPATQPQPQQQSLLTQQKPQQATTGLLGSSGSTTGTGLLGAGLAQKSAGGNMFQTNQGGQQQATMMGNKPGVSFGQTSSVTGAGGIGGLGGTGGGMKFGQPSFGQQGGGQSGIGSMGGLGGKPGFGQSSILGQGQSQQQAQGNKPGFGSFGGGGQQFVGFAGKY